MDAGHVISLDLGRVRYAPQPIPLLEMFASLRMLGVVPAPVHLTRVRERMARQSPSALRRLVEMVSDCGDALLPLVPLEPDLDGGLRTLRSASYLTLRRALRTAIGRRGLRTWATEFAGDAGSRRLCGDLRSYFLGGFAPYWDAIGKSYALEVSRFSHEVQLAGVRPALCGLGTAVSRHSHTLGIVGHPGLRFDTVGRGVLLTPSFLWSRQPLVRLLPDGDVMIVYRAMTRLPADLGVADRTGEALEQLLGCTRALVLRSLASPCGTTDLARRVGISPAAASEHTSVLRDNQLIVTTRHGRSVRHALTGLGRDLLLLPRRPSAPASGGP